MTTPRHLLQSVQSEAITSIPGKVAETILRNIERSKYKKLTQEQADKLRDRLAELQSKPYRWYEVEANRITNAEIEEIRKQLLYGV